MPHDSDNQEYRDKIKNNNSYYQAAFQFNHHIPPYPVGRSYASISLQKTDVTEATTSVTSVLRINDNQENYSPPFVNSMLMRAVTSPMFTAWSPFTSAQMGQQPESSWLSR